MQRNVEHIRNLLAQLLNGTGLIPFTKLDDGEPGNLRFSVFTDGYTVSAQVDRFGVMVAYSQLGDVRDLLILDSQQFRALLVERFSRELVGVYMTPDATDQFFTKVRDNLKTFEEPSEANEQDLVPPDQFPLRQEMLFENLVGNLPLWFVQRMFLSPDVPVAISFKASFNGQLFLEASYKGEHLSYYRLGSLKRLSQLDVYALEQTLLDLIPLPILFFDSFVQAQELPAALLDKTSPYYQSALRNSELSATPLLVSSTPGKSGDYTLKKVEEEEEIGDWKVELVNCEDPTIPQTQRIDVLHTNSVTISPRHFIITRGFYKNHRIVSYVFQHRGKLHVSAREIIF